MGSKALSLKRFWDSAPSGRGTLQPDCLQTLPAATQQYLRHAIAPRSRLAAAVRLRMHGEIRVRRWLPFSAEQVIRWDRGMIWKATARMSGLPIHGWDRLVDGEGAMRWRVLGIIPVTTACGADITRAAAGRLKAESIWLPSVLCCEEVTWSASAPSCLHAAFTLAGETAALKLTTEESGALRSVSLSRWGNPEGGEFHYVDFGGLVEAEGEFGGYTIPTRMRVGWYFGGERFESEGEFLRVTIDDAHYR